MSHRNLIKSHRKSAMFFLWQLLTHRFFRYRYPPSSKYVKDGSYNSMISAHSTTGHRIIWYGHLQRLHSQAFPTELESVNRFCLCYYFLCVLYMLAYVWGNDLVISCLHIDFFMECRPHIHQPIHCTQNVGTFVEQISDFSCVDCTYVWHAHVMDM